MNIHRGRPGPAAGGTWADDAAAPRRKLRRERRRPTCPMATILTQAEIEQALAELKGWRHERDALVKSFEFGSFREAISFMVRAGFEAESLNHHPEWTNVYNRVAVRLNTHDAGGKVTPRDVELARRFDKIAWVE